MTHGRFGGDGAPPRKCNLPYCYMTRSIIPILVLIGAPLAGKCVAANITAAGLTPALVQSAINSARNGDTVILPAGTPMAWTSSVTINKPISVIGAGIDQTVITANKVTPIGINVRHDTGTGDVPFPRLSGLTIQGMPGKAWVGAGGHKAGILFSVYGSTTKFRVDHLKIDSVNGSNLFVVNGPLGVFDHCRFGLRGQATSWVRHPNWNGITGWGDGSWADGPHWAETDKAVYFEDCVWTGGAGGAGNDADNGGRFVIRHSRLSCHVGGHGTESTQRARGTRLVEFYNCISDATGLSINDKPQQVRSGAVSTFNNIFINWKHDPHVFGGGMLARACNSFPPWGMADGVNQWDSNTGMVYQSGTVSAVSFGTTVTIPIAGTTALPANMYKGYVLRRIGGKGGGSVASQITSTLPSTGGTPNTMSITYSPALMSKSMSFGTGARFEIRRVDVILDEPGRGKGDLLRGGSNRLAPTNTVLGGSVWPRNAAEGIYSWNNHQMSLTGPLANGFGLGITGPTKDGRETFSGVIRPGYPQITSPTLAQRRIGPDDSMGETTSFYVETSEVYGAPYPHPLTQSAR
jgi:hypothetical protein